MAACSALAPLDIRPYPETGAPGRELLGARSQEPPHKPVGKPLVVGGADFVDQRLELAGATRPRRRGLEDRCIRPANRDSRAPLAKSQPLPYLETMRRLSLAVLIALLAPAALALSAPEGRYKGKVVGDPDGDVTFKVVGKKVKKFKIDSVTATCYPLTAVTVFVPEAKIKNNRFSRNYKPLPDDEHVVKLRGRFNGSKASGTVEGGPNCVYKEKWTAKRR